MSDGEFPSVLIVENGSQTTLRIESVTRSHGVRAMVLHPKRAEKLLGTGYRPKLAILSGGLASVTDANAPKVPKQLLSLTKGRAPARLFGICYGMQKIADEMGGSVGSTREKREYGRGTIRITGDHELFAGCKKEERVWQSHGDTVIKVPRGFEVTARSQGGGIAAFRNRAGTIRGVQFHPEVDHTAQGRRIIKNLLDLAGCKKDWQPKSMIEAIRAEGFAPIGTNDRAIAGFSGGVDSTTLACLGASILGDRLRGIVIDGGQLREGEIDEIRAHAKAAGVEIKIVNARGLFMRALRGVTDGEKLRKRFKKIYRRILMQEAKKFGAKFILQGTLAPDRIESGATGGDLIKSHHNVGLDFGKLTQLHPLQHLFKYEVRALAKELALPKSVWSRQPFPGPGLFLRIIGGAVTRERLAIVRWADERVTEILKKHRLYHKVSQLVVALDCTKTTAVKGDGRGYVGSIIVRAVNTFDFLTAEGVYFPSKVAKEICSVLSQHEKIGRAMFDPTDKPPATTELR